MDLGIWKREIVKGKNEGTVWRAAVQNTNEMGSSYMNTSQCYNDVARFARIFALCPMSFMR